MDTEQAVDKRFIFHGNAVALAATIRRPETFFVPAIASSCLPVTGGLAEVAVLTSQSFKDIVSFRSASSRATGDYSDIRKAADFTHGNFGQNDLPTNTSVEAALEGFQIRIAQEEKGPSGAPIVKSFIAGKLNAHMESASDRRGTVAFRSLHAIIDGVAVRDSVSPDDAGNLKITLAPEAFSENETKEKLVKRYTEDSDFRKQYFTLFLPPGERDRGGLAGLFGKHEIPNAERGPIVATIVKNIEWQGKPAAGTKISGNRVDIEGIGSIFFGEILIEEGFRRLTLVRFELGSPYGGQGSVCEVQSNGTNWPPLGF
jgi:hypothetical protein